MTRRIVPVYAAKRAVFLCLILAQVAHSTEEYVTKLYAVFAPARFVSSLFSSDLSVGFLLANTAVVVFGLWCWAFPVRSGWRTATVFVWFWAILELANGTTHLLLAVARRGYFPGIATAPLLLFFGAWLAVLQLRETTAQE